MRNIEHENRLATLRSRLSSIENSTRSATHTRTQNSAPYSSVWTQGALHDLYAERHADAVVINAFGLGVAHQAAEGRIIVWGVHEMMGLEAGRPHGPGLHHMGLSPSDVVLVRASDIQTLLVIGEEALRTPTVGAVLLSAWGEARAFSMTASRRLALAAKTGGRTVFMARAGATPAPSAAESRCSVRAAVSRPLEGGAPGQPSFSVALLRKRCGGEPRTWNLEWDRDTRSFREPAPLSGAVVPLAAKRPTEAWDISGRRIA